MRTSLPICFGSSLLILFAAGCVPDITVSDGNDAGSTGGSKTTGTVTGGKSSVGGSSTAGGKSTASTSSGGSSSVGGTSVVSMSVGGSSPVGGTSTVSTPVGGGSPNSGGTSSADGTSSTGVSGATGGARNTGGLTSSTGVSTGGVATDGAASATGGAANTGGASAIGGATTTGGCVATAGALATGGSANTAGTKATGGATASGGTVSTEGAHTIGGTVSTGGMTGTGGANSGGNPTTGGAATTGGAFPTGGATTGGVTNSGGTAGSGCSGGQEFVQSGERQLCVAKIATIAASSSLASYDIDVTEVTRGQYEAWLTTQPQLPDSLDANCGWKSTGSYAAELSCTGDVSSVCQSNCEHHPQVCVDWCDASAYCTAIGKRLCGRIGDATQPAVHSDASSSQWHRACTSGGVNDYPYSNDYNSEACNGYDNASPPRNTTVEVGTLPGCQSNEPGSSGIYDLSGNVWEWEDNCNPLSPNAACNLRGGAFNCYDYSLSCSASDSVVFRDFVGVNVGFRCCSS